MGAFTINLAHERRRRVRNSGPKEPRGGAAPGFDFGRPSVHCRVANRGCEYREQVGRDEGGRGVVEHLAARWRHSDRATWQARVERGEVLLHGRTARPDDVLRAGQWLAWRRPPWDEPDAPLAFAILYRDADLVALAKPRGLPTVPAGGFLEHTLLRLARRLHPELTPLHRLGRGTSGVVLFARTAAARAALLADWRAGRVDKRYLALVSGAPAHRAFDVDARIGRVPHPRLGDVYAATPAGKPALTRVRVVAARDAGTLVEARIPTGRPHQIRIHLAAAGHPLVGDPLYAPGGGLREHPGLPGDGGYRLHAWRLSFTHPTSGRRVEIECPPPGALA